MLDEDKKNAKSFGSRSKIAAFIALAGTCVFYSQNNRKIVYQEQTLDDVSLKSEKPFVNPRHRLEMQDSLNLASLSAEECKATVELLKKGPANIPIEIEAAVASSTKYSDSSFSPDDRSLSYKRWTEVSGFKSNNIFH